jgi:hypothetical protein
MDAFGNSTTFSRVFKNLLESYALDAVDRLEKEIDAGDGAKEASDVLATALAAKAESRPSVGLGMDLRLESEKLVGVALSMKIKSFTYACSRLPATARPRVPAGW